MSIFLIIRITAHLVVEKLIIEIWISSTQYMLYFRNKKEKEPKSYCGSSISLYCCNK
jgi:hypothetical protein